MKHIVFRIVSGLVLLAALAGIAFFAYNAGVAHGSTLNLEQVAPQSGAPGFYPPFAYRPYGHFPLFGFGCFGLLIPFFLFFLVVGAFRRMVWGPRWGMHRHGMQGACAQDGVHPMFAEMHRRAHEAADKEKTEQPGV